MSRGVLLLLTVAVMLFLLAAPAYAADGEGENEGILGFLSDIFSAIGDFFSGIFDAIWDGLKWLFDGIKSLFIPHEDYFPRAFERIKSKLSEKLGGISGLSSYLIGRFDSLRAKRGVDFALEFPSGHLLNGQRLDLLGYGSGIISMVRGALSGFLVLLTFAFCYRRIVGFIET